MTFAMEQAMRDVIEGMNDGLNMIGAICCSCYEWQTGNTPDVGLGVNC